MLQDLIVNTILSFASFFTVDDVCNSLKDKNVTINDSVLSMLDDIFELPWIEPVPFSDKYLVIE